MAAKESTDAEVNAGKEDAAWEARVAKMVTLATLLTSFHLALRGQPIYQEFLQALAHHIRNTWQQARRAGQVSLAREFGVRVLNGDDYY